MTGWRIGFAAGPSKIIKAMTKVQSQTTSCPNSIAQYAALEALYADQKPASDICAHYKEKHNLLVSKLKEIDGFEVNPSEGTLYIFPKVTRLMKILELKRI